MAQEVSGRGRFQRRAQLAGLCHAAGKHDVVVALLQPAMAEMEERKLEEWETQEFLLYPLRTYYLSMAKLGNAYDDREKVYGWICRLDPLQAMKLEK